MTTESVQNHRNLEALYNVSSNKKNCKNKKKIKVTYEEALNYLRTAMEKKEINDSYGKYFGYAKYKAQVIDFKKSNPEVSPEEIKEFKSNVSEAIYSEYFDKVEDSSLKSSDINQNDENFINWKREGLKESRLIRLKEISFKMVALDKFNGILHLITRNQRTTEIKKQSRFGIIKNGELFTQERSININCHSYLQVRISENPSSNDWSRICFDLRSNTMVDQGYLEVDSVHDDNIISTVTGITRQNIKITFLWENHKREVPKHNRDLFKRWGWNPNAYLDRKYLHLKYNDETILFIKSHGDETPLLVQNEIFEEHGLKLRTPTPECFVIPFQDIVELFRERIPNIKSALSVVDSVMDQE